MARKLFTRLGESEGGTHSHEAGTMYPLLFALSRLTSCFRIKHMVTEGEDDVFGHFYRGRSSHRISLAAKHSAQISTDNVFVERPSATQLPARPEKQQPQVMTSLEPLLAVEEEEQNQASRLLSSERVPKKRVTICAVSLPVKPDDEKERSHSDITLTEVSTDKCFEENALRAADRRKRTCSVSYFRMYDPICVEAVSFNDSESDTDEEGDAEEVEQSSEDREDTTGAASLHSSLSLGAIKPSKTTSSSDDANTGNIITGMLLSPLVPFGCPPMTGSHSVSFSTHPWKRSPSTSHSRSRVRSSSVRPGSYRKRSSGRFASTIPFRGIRTQPAESFCPSDRSIWPVIKDLLQNAPADGRYTDGDFLCRFLAKILGADCEKEASIFWVFFCYFVLFFFL